MASITACSILLQSKDGSISSSRQLCFLPHLDSATGIEGQPQLCMKCNLILSNEDSNSKMSAGRAGFAVNRKKTGGAKKVLLYTAP